jgi:nucleoside-diphosphate-sugar epimerase
MHGNIFITGGTGMVGREIVSLLLERTDASVNLLIHENGSGAGKELILKTFFNSPAKSDYVERLNIFHGDITQPNLGLPDTEYQQLTRNITHVIHAAASTRFDLPLREARRINVNGTENAAKFALDCHHGPHFGFISTAYVSGKRTGEIKETELEHDAGFVNSYEQSKCEAELALRKFSGKVPISVYRLSTVIGDSRTGAVSHFIAPHQAIRIMYLGLGAMTPGTPGYEVDLIASDYAADTIFRLYWENFVPGSVFHITHGSGSFTLQEIIEENYRVLGRVDPEWLKRDYPMPVIVNAETFDLFMKSAEVAKNPVVKRMLRTLNSFSGQLVYPKGFDRTELHAALPDYEEGLPDIRDYYGRVIEHCVRTNWGKSQ